MRNAKSAGIFLLWAGEFSVESVLYIPLPTNLKQKCYLSERRKCGKESETERGGRVEKRKRTAKKTVSVLYRYRDFI